MDRITHWFRTQLSNPQIVFLFFVLFGTLLVILYAGNMLAPVIAGIVIAYLLEGIIKKLTILNVPRIIAVWLVFLGFFLFLVSIIFVLLPTLYNQLKEVIQEIPTMLTRGQATLMTLPDDHPELFSVEQVQEIINSMRMEITDFGQTLLTNSISGAVNIITVMIYAVLLPILIFFFLKDKNSILTWIKNFFPNDKQLAIQVWSNVDSQIGNYIRGKFWEILIVWFVTLIIFSLLSIQYSMLLSVLVGLSVLIPYVGAAVVTIPVILIAWFQWGWTSEFATLTILYLIIQTLDGNLLTPLLFSGVVNIHPVAIIVSILFFGGLWGIWGVFFAIPLATLIQAVIVSWPTESSKSKNKNSERLIK